MAKTLKRHRTLSCLTQQDWTSLQYSSKLNSESMSLKMFNSFLADQWDTETHAPSIIPRAGKEAGWPEGVIRAEAGTRIGGNPCRNGSLNSGCWEGMLRTFSEVENWDKKRSSSLITKLRWRQSPVPGHTEKAGAKQSTMARAGTRGIELYQEDQALRWEVWPYIRT